MEDNFQKYTLHLSFKHNKLEKMSRLIFYYLPILQILLKAKQKVVFFLNGTIFHLLSKIYSHKNIGERKLSLLAPN